MVFFMGTLEYNSSHPAIVIEDEALAHLKVIIATKLRRQESFMMTWVTDDEKAPAGRLSAWVHPSIPIVMAFDSASMPPIDATRIARMMQSLNAHGELLIDQTH
jgi:hypothetical protein